MALVLILGTSDAILYTAAAVYAFYLATSLSVIVLRFQEPRMERPYKVTGYPVTSLIFSGVRRSLEYDAILRPRDQTDSPQGDRRHPRRGRLTLRRSPTSARPSGGGSRRDRRQTVDFCINAAITGRATSSFMMI